MTMTTDTRGHHIPLDGALNFRDFGGYKNQHGGYIRPGYFFRSDKLNTLSDDDHGKIDKLAIDAIFDLRRPDEREFAPTRWMTDSATTIHACSLIPPESSAKAMMQEAAQYIEHPDPAKTMMQQLYAKIVTASHSRQYLNQIFTHLLEQPGKPILVHCSGGKDRTGVTCALIQWALGCDQQTIYDDYMLSKSLYCDRVDSNAKFQQMAKGNNDDTLKPEWIQAIMSVFPDYLDAMFEAILDEYEGIEDYLVKGLGLPSDSPQRLQELYVLKL